MFCLYHSSFSTCLLVQYFYIVYIFSSINYYLFFSQMTKYALFITNEIRDKGRVCNFLEFTASSSTNCRYNDTFTILLFPPHPTPCFLMSCDQLTDSSWAAAYKKKKRSELSTCWERSWILGWKSVNRGLKIKNLKARPTGSQYCGLDWSVNVSKPCLRWWL